MFTLDDKLIKYQNDERWKNVKLGNSSETIGSWGGLLTSITMMLNGIGYPDETPITVNNQLIKAGGFLKALPTLPYIAYVWPNCVYHGITRCENSRAPITRIDKQVAAGKPVILQVDSSKRAGMQTHFVLVKDKKGDDYILYDPLKDKGDRPDTDVFLTQRYHYNGGNLNKEISAVLWFDFDKPTLPLPPTRPALEKIPEDRYTLYAAEERLVLRAGPSVEDYPWKCFFKGTQLTGLGSKDKVGEQGQWIQVLDPKGEQGYVSAAFVTDDLSKLLHPVEAEPQLLYKKWCLKKVVVQQRVVEMRCFSPDGNGTIIKDKKPDKSFDTLPQYTVVDVLKSDKSMSGLVKIMYQETYYDYSQKDWVTVSVTGWVNEPDLDDYVEEHQEEFRTPMVSIPRQTESSTDGQQDFYIDAEKTKVRYNMCGELSVAFILGTDIDTVLNQWKNDANAASRAMFNSMVWNTDQPLGISHMENLFRLHAVDYERYKPDNKSTSGNVAVRLADPEGDERLASQDLETRLKDWYFITNLKINTHTGDLERAQSADERNHWVVLDRITCDRSRVELYNPFPNRLEEYSFGEFYHSIHGDPNAGWWIKRTVEPTSARQKLSAAIRAKAAGQQKAGVSLPAAEKFSPPKFEVAIDNRTAYEKDAEQYLYIRGEGNRPKTKLCGEFSVTFILGQSLDNSLKHWMEKQANQAGLRELATLLQAYGFNRRKYIKPSDKKTELGKYYVAPNNKLGLPSGTQEYFKSFSIDTVLEYWKGVQPVLYNSILGGNQNEPTGPDDLLTILKAYGYSQDDFSYYRPGSQESFGLAPGRDAAVIGKTHFLLVGVNINGTTGRLQPAGVPHWVVLTKLSPRGNLVGGNGGWVELYNPFPNCWEEYSYREFMDSFRGSSAGSTLWVKMDISPVFIRQRVAPPKSKEKNPPINTNQAATGQKGDKKDPRPDKDKRKKGAGLEPVDDNPPLDVNRVVCEHLDVEMIPWEIGEWIRTTAQGDEYFAEELAETLYESGILSVQEEVVGNKKKRKAVLTDPEFSHRLESALQANLDRLASSPRSWDPALKVARVALPLFTRTAVEEIRKLREHIPVHTYQRLDDFRAWTRGLGSKGKDPLEVDIKKRVEGLINSAPDQDEQIQVCYTALTRPTFSAFEQEIVKIQSDKKTLSKIKALWKIKKQEDISFAQVREWARGLTSKPDQPIICRIKKWGDPGMIDTGALIAQGQSSNFQAVSLYNTATGFGAISNYLVIPADDVRRLEALQIEDDYVDKQEDDWLHQKMNWLCQFRGSIYMFAEGDNYRGDWPWRRREGIRWGTLALGGNLVQVIGTDRFDVKLPAKQKVESVKMARVQGFTPADWGRPMDQLLAEGLVHRCFCVYQGDDLGDSPKGIVYSPFWSLGYWEFMPKPKGVPAPTALWIPFDYLEDPPEE